MSIKTKVQSFGRFLSGMVMPNIGAFIAWGLITALFIPVGWWPNEQLAAMVDPILFYLLPILIGYTGGKIVAGDRGGLVGAIATMGVIVGTDIPMFMGAMMIGPLSGLAIKTFDKLIAGKVKTGFEMLVNNFSIGIIGMIIAIIAFYFFGPFVEVISMGLGYGVGWLVENGLLFLTSVIVEPAKVLFLNNAINHGVFTPIGLEQATEVGKSILFLIEANPGPGLGLLLAYSFFGTGSAKSTAPGAVIIHFFGGIHEIYFPYVLMNPKLLLGVIAGGMSGVLTLSLLGAGLVAPASPGSIIAISALAPKGELLPVLAGIAVAAAVSFFVCAIILKASKPQEESIEEMNEKMATMKAEAKGFAPVEVAPIAKLAVKKIIVACDAGMGSSAMGATMLRGKLKDAGLEIEVANAAVNSLSDASCDLIITHQSLVERATGQAPNTRIIPLINFMDQAFYQSVIVELTGAPEVAPVEEAVAPKVAVKKIVVACDAGMGSSAMGATMLRNKLKEAGLEIEVTNAAVNSLNDASCDLIITHQSLVERATGVAPNTRIIPLVNFMDQSFYTTVVEELK